MEFKYLRYKLFYKLRNPFANWARRRRMENMIALTGIRDGMRILDLGGSPHIWNFAFIPDLDITILNLPGAVEKLSGSQRNFHYAEGDGCNVDWVSDQSFDLVFSNSVIEHVGGAERRAAFAREVRRIGKRHWVQTPSKWFPIEAHNGMPFWWFYPIALRQFFIAAWRKKLPAWTDMVEGTVVISKSELRQLFPESKLIVERVLGIPKSYIAISSAHSQELHT